MIMVEVFSYYEYVYSLLADCETLIGQLQLAGSC